MKRALKSSCGFTFLEALAALVILSVALIPIMAWVPVSMQTKIKAERLTIASFLCQSKIEELHYNIINDFSKDYNRDSFPFSVPFQDYFYKVSDDLGSNLKTISVNVWQIGAPEKQTTFYTQVAKR